MDDRLAALLALLGGMSLLAFALFGLDKAKARRGGRRVPEATLLCAALLGGGIGAFAGMRLFRHKTRKPPFPVLVPLLALLQAALAAAAWAYPTFSP